MKRFRRKSSKCHQVASLSEEYPLEIGDSRNMPIPAMVAAMDNHLILQEIFSFLSPADQRICCDVSEKWRAIAGPMIFEYHIKVDRCSGIRVEVSRGYLNPQVDKRELSPEEETEYLEALKRRNCFISLEFFGGPWTSEAHEKNYRTVGFVWKFRSRVFKLSCSNYSHLHKFFGESTSKQDLELLHYFPNCEEYCVKRVRSLDLFFDVKIPSQMKHLRKVYHGIVGSECKRNLFPTKTPTFLQMIPNLQEIHGLPFTMISQFEKVKKLHLIRSIRFHGVDDKRVGTEAMKTMVRLGIKFKFLRLGSNTVPWEAKKEFMERNKQQFEDLLEIGKDTLQHLALHFDRYVEDSEFIRFPATMSALTHLTLKIPMSPGPVHFPTNFNFSKCFPKLESISFPPMTLAQWDKGGSWWSSKGKLFSRKSREGITNLRCYRSLGRTIQRELLKRFPAVNCIEFVSNIDDTDVDGIVSD